jgi:DNA adenine methylase
MGGKRRLADRLIPLFPPHECYVEVFAGGAALYFMRPQAAPVEVLNDINGDLVTLYRVVQNRRIRAPVQMGAQLAPGI